MAYEHLLLEQDAGVATLTLNRPEKQNALSQGLMAELRDAFDAIDRDPHVRVVLITGAGRAFSSGFDLSPENWLLMPPRMRRIGVASLNSISTLSCASGIYGNR